MTTAARILSAIFDDSAAAWERATYAFLAEKERRSGSRSTVESYSRMLRDFSGRLGKSPDTVSDHNIGSRRNSRCVPGPKQPARRDGPNLRSNIVALRVAQFVVVALAAVDLVPLGVAVGTFLGATAASAPLALGAEWRGPHSHELEREWERTKQQYGLRPQRNMRQPASLRRRRFVSRRAVLLRALTFAGPLTAGVGQLLRVVLN